VIIDQLPHFWLEVDQRLRIKVNRMLHYHSAAPTNWLKAMALLRVMPACPSTVA